MFNKYERSFNQLTTHLVQSWINGPNNIKVYNQTSVWQPQLGPDKDTINLSLIEFDFFDGVNIFDEGPQQHYSVQQRFSTWGMHSPKSMQAVCRGYEEFKVNSK